MYIYECPNEGLISRRVSSNERIESARTNIESWLAISKPQDWIDLGSMKDLCWVRNFALLLHAYFQVMIVGGTFGPTYDERKEKTRASPSSRNFYHYSSFFRLYTSTSKYILVRQAGAKRYLTNSMSSTVHVSLIHHR